MRRLTPLLLLLLVLAAACGGGQTAADPADAPVPAGTAPVPKVVDDAERAGAPAKAGARAVSAAAVATEKVGSARVDFTFSGLPGGEAMTGTGAIDFDAGASQMTFRLPASVAGGEAGSFESVMADGYAYVRAPGAALPQGKTWMAMNVNELAGADIAQQQTQDPAEMLRWLEATSGGVTAAGTGTVRGVEATRYHAVVDLAAAAGEAGMSTADAARFRQEAAAIGMDELPLDVWVDGDGYVRRIALEMTAGGTALAMRMDLYDFGVDVQVTAPPAADTFDATEAIAAQQ